MPLQHDEPSALIYKLVHDRLGALAYHRAFCTPHLSEADPDDLQISTPHRVGFLTTHGLEAGSMWHRAIEPGGWRFLIHHGDKVVAAVDTVIGKNGKHRFGHIYEGPLVAGTEEAIRFAEEHATIRSSNFQPILVIAPSLSVSFLLLRNRTTNCSDHLIALPPLFAGLQGGELLRPEDVATVLRNISIRKRAHASNSPEGQGSIN